jgi:amino acid adenylation domain-containing protein
MSDPVQGEGNRILANPAQNLHHAVENSASEPSNPFISFPKAEIEQSIPQRFQQMVGKFPERIAVRGRKYTVTYDALNRFANRIAQAILALQRERQAVIGLLLEKDAPMMAALLGVLKVANIYLALDPAQPAARASKMLEDAQAELLITDERNLAVARELSRVTRKVLNLGILDSTLSEENISIAIPPDALAYIIYTSGSTGEPKGVVQNHRNVLRNIREHTNCLHISPEDRLSLLASCSTGQAGTDIYGALLNGATLCPFGIKEEGLARLVEWLREEEITIYHSSASIFRYFLDTMDARERYPQLRVIKLGSEPLFTRDVELFRGRFSDNCILVNALSSSEAGTFRKILIGKRTAIQSSVVPVGFPVEDMEVTLLDDAGHPVGFDTAGEIVIKSPYLAPGYWRKPELTNAVFSSDSLGGGVRLFRTGDMGRMAPDGCLEYQGRKDQQVKIRGFRVEVAEVEAVLLELGRFKQTAVVVGEDRRGEKRLTAYVVPAESPIPSVASLRASLREKLPDHMVPSEFIMMDSLPFTPNGKLDRNSLSTAKPRPIGGDVIYVKPRSPLEWQIVHLWENLLGVRPVGIQDDFFALGGDSLLAVRMIDEIEKVSGTKLPLTTLWTEATVEQLSKNILSANLENFQSPLVAVQTEGSALPFFFLHGDFDGGGFYCRTLARHLGKDRPFYALQPHGLEGQVIPHSIEAMAADRLATLLDFRPQGPYLLGGHCNGGFVAFEMARQLEARNLKVDLLVIIDASAMNFQFRWVRGLMSLVGLVLRLDDDRQLKWFKRLRSFLIRLRELSQEKTHVQVLFVLGEMHRIVKRVASAFVSARRQFPTDTRSEPVSVPGCRGAEYHAVIEGYVPGRYKGRIVFFRSTSMQSRAPADPTAGWGQVASDVEVHWLPGDHQTCLTEHVETLAEHLASCLGKE